MIKEEKPVTKLLIENAKQILTMQGESNHDVGMLEGGSIYIEGNLIKAIGPKADVDKYVEGIEDVQHINAQGKVICPGFIDTDMTRGVPENVWQIMISKIPAGYAGEAKDVGECVAFLASDGARYINGEVINVGGGMVL